MGYFHMPNFAISVKRKEEILTPFLFKKQKGSSWTKLCKQLQTYKMLKSLTPSQKLPQSTIKDSPQRRGLPCQSTPSWPSSRLVFLLYLQTTCQRLWRISLRRITMISFRKDWMDTSKLRVSSKKIDWIRRPWMIHLEEGRPESYLLITARKYCLR